MSQTTTIPIPLEPRGFDAEQQSEKMPDLQSADSIRKSSEVLSSDTPPPNGQYGQKAYPERSRAYLVIAHLTTVTAMTSMSTGLITTSIPRMALDLSIPPQTQYWPLSVYGLTSGACLLVAGAVADVVGSKRVFMIGNLFLSVFILACGLAQTEIQLVMFRAMQGIAVATCLPTSVGILTNAIAPGRRRNVGFACTGLGQPLGFSIGLVFGGIFIDTVGWRVGWYIVASVLFALVPLGLYLLPADTLDEPPSLHSLRTKIDWVGAVIAAAALSMLAFVLVQLSGSESMIHKPAVIACLAISLVLILAFPFWMNLAARRNWPVLIPNSLWKQLPFTSVCIMVLLSYGVMQTMELFCSLFFQNVQRLSPLQASIRLLPSMIVGAILNLTTGLFIHRMSPFYLVFASSFICAGAPLLMALIHPQWPYWYAAFPAQVLEPMSADILFCVGLIIISEVFPDNTQALAGAVFNTVAQFGTSIGLALIGVTADNITQKSHYVDKTSPDALFTGFKAAFWVAFGWMLLICITAVIGLKNIGRVGLKRE